MCYSFCYWRAAQRKPGTRFGGQISWQEYQLPRFVIRLPSRQTKGKAEKQLAS